MSLPDDFFKDLPCLEQLLRAKPEFPYMIERALLKAADDIHDPNKPAAAKREVKIVISMMPESDRGSVRMQMAPPEVVEAKSPAVAAQMSLVDTKDGLKFIAYEDRQQSIQGLGAN